MSFKPIILKSEEALHSVTAARGKLFAVITKSVQNEGFSRKAVSLVEIEEDIVQVIPDNANTKPGAFTKGKP